MAQSDFVIENASGAVVRAEMNTALEAGVTLSSGGVPPATTYPNQWWFDTSTNILRIRNNANTAWLDAAQKTVNAWNIYTAGQLLDDLAVFEPLVGEIRLYGGTAAPAKWYLCNGQALSRGTHAGLFGVLGTAYGNGDGVSTFNVPNFSGRTIIGAGQGNTAEGGALGTLRSRGDLGGAETHSLTEAENGPHSHGSNTTRVDESNAINVLDPNGGFSKENTDFSGSGAPHNNMSPFGVATAIIYSGV